MNDDIILKAENLCFSYEEEPDSHPLNGLNLEIRRGEKVAVMGSNGSGKSTFFLCCNGIHRPTSGTLYFHGKPVSYGKKELLELRSKVGIVFQDPDNQLFSASVYQEISFGPLTLGMDEQKAQQEVEAVIEQLEITPFRHKPTHALSGGQKKQVSIADILVMHPEIVILDEPAAALDPRHTAIVSHIVNQLTDQGITVLMSTHDADYAYQWADRVIIFHEGRVLTEGTPQQVFRQKELLQKSNLNQPAILELYDSLCEAGKLSSNGQAPRNLQQLKQLLMGCMASLS